MNKQNMKVFRTHTAAYLTTWQCTERTDLDPKLAV